MEGMSDLNALNLESGEVVGGYTLISRLGSGAMGSVWRVRDDGGTTYAMKILRDSLTDESVAGSGSASTALHDPDLKPDVTPRERLRREAMALKKVNHPGVCGIVDMELDDTLAFIVTELIEGKNLKDDVAANGRYVGDDLERLARKLIEATKAVHAAGIVHRDIKPTNVMVSAAGPVLVDFGIAMGEGESHVTRTGLVMGTPGFIAPEIIDGAESDDATDWWSVASVLAFAATGAPVFGTKPMMAVLEREASGNANLSGLPAGTLAAFRSALDPDRRDRCTPDQLLNAIALDALNPNAWQGEQAGPFAAGAVAGQPAAIVAEAAEAMPPFGAAGGVDRNNPRTIWRAAEEAAEAPTMAVFSGNKGDNGDGETVVFSPAGAATATLPLADMPPRPPAGAEQATPLAERTTVLPTPQPSSFPPSGTAQSSWDPASNQPTAVDPAIRPALQRIIDQTAQAAPTETMVQNPPMPNPVDVKRGEYLQRGTLPLILLAAPLAALAANAPLVAIIAATALLWLLLTLAYNTEPQLEREGKRGGERKNSDSWIRVATFPWHLVKALLLAIPRILLLVIIYMAGTAVATAALALPVHTISWYFTADWGIPVPLLNDVPFSASGLALGGFMAIGWLVTVFAPQSMMIRLGGGVLRGLKHSRPAGAPSTEVGGAPPAPVAPAPKGGGRGTVLFTIWAIITVALCAMPILGMPINWMPFA
ncbi:MAG: protein kinase domain-containing protein [Bifidobacterium longum]|uniref:serine/threonine-protein kinase n=1 Tax=Bifidobacterium longum TaxID=216816 RepID=UPI0007199BEA|nr:serine/threonine-protein kinase [Bifidobacterium longum]KSA08739.1 protein kinase [Bifidobacterium longum subsp. longum]KSA11030.1 protein kinase [Bifidobacterium longum subsp. longum]MDB6735449.1 protein kinase [Bifidobacterium longum]NRC99573.1 protein kinase [Bifidobacterium longum subsp. longum]